MRPGERIKVFINNYNRVSTLKPMVEQVLGFDDLDEVVIIDNNSTYPPLLAYYENLPAGVRVIRLPQNMGHLAAWTSGVVETHGGLYYAVSDPDLDLSGVPADCLSHLVDGLRRYPYYNKCGLSLEVNDLPVNRPTVMSVLEHERTMWQNPLDEEFFGCTCDTTFAVYYKPRVVPFNYKKVGGDFTFALRANRPYTARHTPWYLDPATPSDEDIYYWQSCRHDSTGWSYLKAQEAGVRP